MQAEPMIDSKTTACKQYKCVQAAQAHASRTNACKQHRCMQTVQLHASSSSGVAGRSATPDHLDGGQVIEEEHARHVLPLLYLSPLEVLRH